ncbi:class II D-tagatose-bisphosphate aldolase, non-catalytic subunit [uncultured Methanobrevibacter sp.]|uniref:class II D-tagatose-bisphosphate aldolase, non-catalytic subunit n=1 Tax=uncultured Methanobrevibacter sp. TaxID=253161 RepID=UPI0025F15E40|nr:class II D-tagatose-bisphosphate aldolase, non-catalytic subunit [uncultured Methanobrevibacter sp.]
MKHPIKEILDKRKQGINSGIASYCTANNIVIEAILEYYLEKDEYVLIECTANQVNQFGGYTGMTPADFRDYVYDIADKVGFPKDRIILGADHFGPLAWADKSESEAMKNAKELVRLAVLAGYTKIHLDTSMFLGSDDTSKKLSDEIIAQRGAELYKVCEDTFLERIEKYPNSIHPVYVIGSEVPIPGGEYKEKSNLEVTSPQDFENTVDTYDKIFNEYGFEDFWDNIVAVVVQPGVEFSNEDVHDYDRTDSKELCRKLKEHPNLVFEGHSTDFQFKEKLKEMVEDGVAILKVGPALTFALRESLFSLSLMEKELIKNGTERANFIELLDNTMVTNPKDWKKYYHGNELEKELQRKYSFSDRSRYYISRNDLNLCINRLFENIDSHELTLGLIKQFLPNEYIEIRKGNLTKEAALLVKFSINNVLNDYKYAIEK